MADHVLWPASEQMKSRYDNIVRTLRLLFTSAPRFIFTRQESYRIPISVSTRNLKISASTSSEKSDFLTQILRLSWLNDIWTFIICKIFWYWRIMTMNNCKYKKNNCKYLFVDSQMILSLNVEALVQMSSLWMTRIRIYNAITPSQTEQKRQSSTHISFPIA